MLSGRINTHKDELGAIFIDRDPELFRYLYILLKKNIPIPPPIHHSPSFGNIKQFIRIKKGTEEIKKGKSV